MPAVLFRISAFLQKQVLDTVCVALLAMVLVVVTFQVLNRFMLGLPIAWTEEAARYLFVWLSLLGAVRGVRDKAHLQVDLIVRMLPARVEKILDLLGGIVVAVLLWEVVESALILLPLTWTRRIATMNVPIFYLYVATPLAAGLMFLFTLRNIMQDARSLPGKPVSANQP
ncbi:TRAP transporter small permease [Desulfoferula mesophila]|uniref:Permease n=1 Tax=Desulfoferula mesophila TaxID=3058419 RepID=A0AAU9E7Q1_9BACT|nr:permease [Desulfoferula mesophilus]